MESPDAYEWVAVPQRSWEEREPRLIAQCLDDEHPVGIREVHARRAAASLDHAPHPIREIPLERRRVQPSLQPTTLDAHEKCVSDQALDERFGRSRQVVEHRVEREAQGVLDGQQPRERRRQQRVAREPLCHSVEKCRAFVDRAHHDVAIAAGTEPAEPPQRHEERVAPTLERSGENVEARHATGDYAEPPPRCNRFPPREAIAIRRLRMRVLTLGLALAVLVARPAGAARMLYATAATPNRIDGFCVRDNGALAPTPSVRLEIRGTQPRRIVVVDDVLYAVEADRVEAFRIGPRGGLSLLGRTQPRPRSGPRDAALSSNRTMLYVPDRSRSRIVGHALDADGRPAADFTTCLQGEIGASYQNLVVNGDKLYVSSSAGSGRIQAFGIAADGTLFGSTGSPTVSECVGATADAARPPATPPLSERRKIGDVKSFVIVGDLVYAEDRLRRRIRAFRLQPDGNFPPSTDVKNCENAGPSAGITCVADTDCVNDVACSEGICNCKTRKRTWPRAESKTKRVAQYQMILHHGSALLGTQFFRGRIDSYALGADGQLPRRPARLSRADLRFTPVRLTTDQNVAYVAAGEFDRILAYRLRENGVLAATDPFSQTDEQEGSFPNDVAIAMLAAGCGF